MTEEKQKIPELKVIPAEELLDTTYAPSGTLIDGLMGQGIYILAGAPKVGKSWLVLWLANQVSKGEPVWGMKTEQCGVLYISFASGCQGKQNVTDSAGAGFGEDSRSAEGGKPFAGCLEGNVLWVGCRVTTPAQVSRG